MFESHRPFIQAVKSRSNKWTVAELEAYIAGDLKDDTLAKAFGKWDHGDSQGVTDAINGTNDDKTKIPFNLQ